MVILLSTAPVLSRSDGSLISFLSLSLSTQSNPHATQHPPSSLQGERSIFYSIDFLFSLSLPLCSYLSSPRVCFSFLACLPQSAGVRSWSVTGYCPLPLMISFLLSLSLFLPLSLSSFWFLFSLSFRIPPPSRSK